jgi:hypothetical protein
MRGVCVFVCAHVQASDIADLMGLPLQDAAPLLARQVRLDDTLGSNMVDMVAAPQS